MRPSWRRSAGDRDEDDSGGDVNGGPGAGCGDGDVAEEARPSWVRSAGCW